MGKFKLTFRRNGVLSRFTGAYFLLLAILILMCVITYKNAADISYRQVVGENMQKMEQTASNLHKSLGEADHFSASLQKITELGRFMECRDMQDAQALIRMNEVLRVLPAFKDSSGLFTRYSILSSATGAVVEPLKGYTSPERYYQEYFRCGEKTYDQWAEELLSGNMRQSALVPVQETVVSTNAEPVSGRAMLYIRPLFFSHRLRGNTGYVLFYLDEARLRAEIQAIQPEISPYYALFSREGEFLCGDGWLTEALESWPDSRKPAGTFIANLSRGSMALTYCQTADGALTVVAALPRSFFTQQAMEVIRPMLISLLALLIFSVPLTFLLWNSARKPLLATLDKLQLRGKGGLWQIDQAVHQLLRDNSRLQRTLEDQRLSLRAAFFGRLYNGESVSREEMQGMLKLIGVPLDQKRFYRGVALKFKFLQEAPTDQAEYLRTLLVEILSAASQKLIILSPADAETLLLLHSTDQEDENGQQLIQDLQQLGTGLNENHQLEIRFYAGFPVDNPCRLPQSLSACRRLAQQESGDGQWIHIAKRPETGGYCYTPADEQLLIRQTKAGNYPAVEEALEKIQEKNRQRALSQLQLQLLGSRMLDTVVQMNAEALPLDELFRPQLFMTPEAFFQQLKGVYRMLCREAVECREQKANQLAADVIQYIDHHFDQYEMSLTTLAIQFGVTEKYISAFMKKKVGVNFLTYLEGLRISKADQLLRETDLTIDEIARQVGYANGKAFRRVYQRIVGQSPSLCREEQDAESVSGAT